MTLDWNSQGRLIGIQVFITGNKSCNPSLSLYLIHGTHFNLPCGCLPDRQLSIWCQLLPLQHSIHQLKLIMTFLKLSLVSVTSACIFSLHWKGSPFTEASLNNGIITKQKHHQTILKFAYMVS